MVDLADWVCLGFVFDGDLFEGALIDDFAGFGSAVGQFLEKELPVCRFFLVAG